MPTETLFKIWLVVSFSLHEVQGQKSQGLILAVTPPTFWELDIEDRQIDKSFF